MSLLSGEPWMCNSGSLLLCLVGRVLDALGVDSSGAEPLPGPCCPWGLGWSEKLTIPLCWSVFFQKICKNQPGELSRRSLVGEGHRNTLCLLSTVKPPSAIEPTVSPAIMTALEFLEFFTALPKHLNVELRCSTVCPRWLIKSRTKPLLPRVVEEQTLSKNNCVFWNTEMKSFQCCKLPI